MNEMEIGNTMLDIKELKYQYLAKDLCVIQLKAIIRPNNCNDNLMLCFGYGSIHIIKKSMQFTFTRYAYS